LEKGNVLGDSSKRRPADVFIGNWGGGKSLCIDVAVIDPTQEKYVLLPGANERYASQVKMAKYASAFVGTDLTYLPMVWDTFGCVTSSGLEALSRLIKMAADATGEPRSVVGSLAWAFLSCRLQNSIGHMILSRVPSEDIFGGW
jgi:hypothetical protein